MAGFPLCPPSSEIFAVLAMALSFGQIVASARIGDRGLFERRGQKILSDGDLTLEQLVGSFGAKAAIAAGAPHFRLAICCRSIWTGLEGGR